MGGDLVKPNEKDGAVAMEILHHRLALLRKPGSYMFMATGYLPLSTRAFNVLKIAKLYTVWNIVE